MLEKFSEPWKLILTIYLFPLAIQGPIIDFLFTSTDTIDITSIKIIFLALPMLGFLFACWSTVISIATVIIRQERSRFMSILFVTWWDLGRSIFSFWAGIFKFVFVLAGNILLLTRLAFVLLWISMQDIFLSPLKVMKSVGSSYAKEGTPWLAVGLLIGWSIVEATIFTYVITDTAMNILANFAQQELEPMMIQPILFLMMTVFVLGSYAVVTELGNAIKMRNWYMIAFISIFEICVASFEVLFLYREFVDALLLGLQAHTADMKVGVFGILGISTLVWFGIRGMTWFLFAEAGSPTIMAIIQRTGLQITGQSSKVQKEGKPKQLFEYTSNALDSLKKNSAFVHEKSDEIFDAFLLPALQILAVCINFASVVLSAKHIFNLPFSNLKEVLQARDLIAKATSNK